MVNFILTAENPSGRSQPHVIEGAPGIDPDIFFDDNGKFGLLGLMILKTLTKMESVKFGFKN